MKIKWTKEYEYDFPDDEIMDIAEAAIGRSSWYRLDRLKADIRQEIYAVVSDVNMPWGKEQTDIIANTVLDRAGGVQLSMFEDEEILCGAIKEEE